MTDVFCNRCGHRNPAGARFCSSCGSPLGQIGEERTDTLVFGETPADTGEQAAVRLGPGDLGEGAAVLVITRGPGAGSRFALEDDVVSAGRHPDSDIFLDDITVSRRHAEIIRDAEGYAVHDVGSLNGTYLNRERIDEARLANGDELQIGKFKLVFFTGGAG